MLKKHWSNQEVEKMVTLFLSGMSLSQVAEALDRTRASISNKWQKDKLHKEHPGMPYQTKIHIVPKDSLNEKWRQHPVLKNYYFSEYGNAWSANSGKQLSPYRLSTDVKNQKGLWLKINGKVMKVSRLVAETWLGLKEDQVVLHKNRNKCDNDIFNLIVTDKRRAGQVTGHFSKSVPVALYREDKVARVFRSSRDAAKKLGISYQTVLDYAHGKTKNPRHDIRFYKAPKRVRDRE